jgi:hypothetical protein
MHLVAGHFAPHYLEWQYALLCLLLQLTSPTLSFPLPWPAAPFCCPVPTLVMCINISTFAGLLQPRRHLHLRQLIMPRRGR